MSIVGWLILGLIAGFIGSKIVNKNGEGLVFDIVLGVLGAVVGGYLFTLLGAAPVTGLNIYSMVVAVIGAIVVLVLYHAVFGRGRVWCGGARRLIGTHRRTGFLGRSEDSRRVRRLRNAAERPITSSTFRTEDLNTTSMPPATRCKRDAAAIRS